MCAPYPSGLDAPYAPPPAASCASSTWRRRSEGRMPISPLRALSTAIFCVYPGVNTVCCKLLSMLPICALVMDNGESLPKKWQSSCEFQTRLKERSRETHLELGHQGVQLGLLLFEFRRECILFLIIALSSKLLLYILNSRFKSRLGVELIRG